MSLTKLRFLNWGMVILGIVVPFVPPIFHKGVFEGISYTMSDCHSIEMVIFLLLIFAAPYLLVASLQYTFCALRWTQYLLLLNLAMFAIQTIVYFVFYDTFVIGLLILGFPFIFSLPIIFVVASAYKRNHAG